MIEKFSKNSENNKDDDLDLSALLRLILRNKIVIFKFGIIFFIGACLYAISQKRVWQGQFEIVIQDPDKVGDSSTSSLQSVLAQANLTLGGGGSADDLITEVGIIKSQSVLMPIFDYTNKKKLELDNKYKIPSFSSWSNQLKINLVKNTSIVHIKYKDQNKNIIIPVLQEIGKRYQDYSKSRKNRAVVLSKTYLKEQIEIYKIRSKNSKREAINYAIEQNLNLNDVDTNTNFNAGKSINVALDAIGMIEALDNPLKDRDPNSLDELRVSLKNEINELDLQIEKVKELSDINDLQYIGATIDPLIKQGLPQTLEKIETQLMQLRTKYTEKDSTIINLLKTRDLYTNLLKDRTIGYLKAKKVSFESKLQSIQRPKGVIVKGKELMREANRDNNTLVELENNLRNIELYEAKLEDPWQLITEPSLSNIPVYPNRKVMALFGLLTGLTFGTGFAYWREKDSDLIFEESELEKICSIPILKRLSQNEAQTGITKKELRFEELEIIAKNKIKLILLSNDNESEIKQRFENLYSSLSKEKYDLVFSVANLNDVNPKDINIIVTSLGKLTNLDVKDFKNRLDLLNIKLSGIIII